MAPLPGQRVYQSGLFEAVGLLGQLFLALPNLDLFAGSVGLWMRVAGLAMATVYVCVLLMRAFLPDRVLEAESQSQGLMSALPVRLRAGNRGVIVPVTLVAVLAAGFSLFGAQLLGLNSDTAPPDAPPNLRSIGATAAQIDLAWDAAIDDDGEVLEYRVVRRDNGLERTSASTTFHDTLSIGGGRTYEYRVIAVDAAGNLSPASALTVTTPASDPAACAVDRTPPAQPDKVRASIITSTSVTLEWDPTTDVGTCGLAGYRVLRDGQDTGIVAAGSTVTEEGLEPDQSYVYTVLAQDNARNESAPSGGLTVKTLARPIQTASPCDLTAPRGLHSTSITTTSVSLAWSPPLEECDNANYRVFRGGMFVGQTTGLSFTVPGLTPATAYVFTIRARTASGELSPSSNLLSVTTATPPPPPGPAPDTTPPTVPTNVHLVSRTDTSLALAWTPSTDADSGIAGYVVRINGGAALPTTTASMAFGGLAPGTSYAIDVAATDHAGLSSGFVQGVFRTYPAGPPTVVVSPPSATVGVDPPFTVSGDNVDPGSSVAVTIDGRVVANTVAAGDGTYSASFAVQSDGTVSGTDLQLVPGEYVVQVTSDCPCGPGTGTATLLITESPM